MRIHGLPVLCVTAARTEDMVSSSTSYTLSPSGLPSGCLKQQGSNLVVANCPTNPASDPVRDRTQTLMHVQTSLDFTTACTLACVKACAPIGVVLCGWLCVHVPGHACMGRCGLLMPCQGHKTLCLWCVLVSSCRILYGPLRYKVPLSS